MGLFYAFIQCFESKQGIPLIIDFHTHILPCIDDGSRNVETSLEMITASKEQGVEWLVATPHFYATRDRVDGFLSRRSESWETLSQRLTPELPRITLGAEVAFFRGISKAERLNALSIDGTNSLLLEMPFREWSKDTVDEVEKLIDRGFNIILAHIERYLSMRENAAYVEQLLEMPLMTQINAEGLLDWRQRGRLIKMVKNGQVQILGSDCHGMEHRPPNLGEGRRVLLNKLGQEYLDEIDRCSERLLLG